jgi:hypothetical protein
MTALLLTATLGGLTPSTDLGARLAALEAQRESIDQRRTPAQVMRVAAALAYVGSAGSLLWAIAEGLEGLSYVLSPRHYQPAVPAESLTWSWGMCLAAALGLHLASVLYGHQLDQELEVVDSEVEQVERQQRRGMGQRWLELDTRVPPAPPLPPPAQ